MFYSQEKEEEKVWVETLLWADTSFKHTGIFCFKGVGTFNFLLYFSVQK